MLTTIVLAFLACFVGVRADSPCTADIVYVVDTSTSICENELINQDCKNFDSMKTFLQRFTNSFTVSADGTHVAMVYFSDPAQTSDLFDLNWYTDNASVDQSIQLFNYWAVQGPLGHTDTGEALTIVNDKVLTEAYGDRPDSPNIVIIFTDGYWTVGPNPITVAESLWARGDTYIYAVAIGSNFTAPNLYDIAQITRSWNNIFSVDSYLALGDVLRQELLNVTGCSVGPADHCSSHPCKNGGTCQNTATTFQCTCPPGFLGIDCSQVDPCAVNRCQHGGTCLRNGNSYTCECYGSWLGQSCEEPNPCGDEPCTQAQTVTPHNYGHCLPSGTTIDCSAMDPGNYGDPTTPCASHYYQCAAGTMYTMQCGSDLIYDCVNDYCNYKSSVAACQ